MIASSAVLAVIVTLGVCGVLSLAAVWVISVLENRAAMRHRSILHHLVKLMATTKSESADDSATAATPLIRAAEATPPTTGRAAA